MKPEVGGFVGGGEAGCPGSAAPSPNSKQSLLEGVVGLEGWFTFWAEAMQSQRFYVVAVTSSIIATTPSWVFIVEATGAAQWELWFPWGSGTRPSLSRDTLLSMN